MQAVITAQHQELKHANVHLEQRVKERTSELEQSKRQVEALKGKVEEALYATMDSSVVNLIIEGRLRNEKRSLSVLFCDLVQFTSYSEDHPPEVVIRDLNRFFSQMEPIILAYRGHIDKYMGDAIMCEFGAPVDYPTYRLMAVLAALKMQERLGKLGAAWSMRIGIGSGPMITGLIGSKRQTYTAIGDVVNLASRLEQSCQPGKVLLDRFTYDGVSQIVEARKKLDLPMKPVTDPAIERALQDLHDRIAAEPGRADLYFQVGRLHWDLQECAEALDYYEQALGLDPANTAFKVAYAEAGLKIKELEKLTLRGKRQRIEAFEVVGLRDPLLNRAKIPAGCYERYRSVPDLIQVPEDVIAPVEALDGSLGHARVVAVLAYALAGTFHLSETEKLDILSAAYLADIGKEIVPYHLLNRQGSLSKTEMDTTTNGGTRSSCTAMNTSTGRASRAASQGRRFRSAPGSWRSPTPTMP
jgi:class 3 adenylate cyclase